MTLQHATIAGPADGMPVVFLHGATLNREMWNRQTDVLSARYRTVAMDLPGHGTRTEERFRMGDAAAEIAALISDLGEPAVVVGFSLGGYVAIRAAASEPDLVRGLVVAGAIDPYRGLSKHFLRIFNVMVGFAPEGFKSRAIEGMARAVPPTDAAEVLGAGLSMKAGAEGLAQVPRMGLHRLLASYPGTVLIINGERDRPNRGAEKRAVRACREGLVRTIGNAGHTCSLTQPGAFTHELRGFLLTL
jgi:pimeloyl-ACP methyl ester carboxylesterase